MDIFISAFTFAHRFIAMAVLPETLKAEDPTLRGTIPDILAREDAASFPEADTQFLKFHGIYQQDDRDVRREGKHFQFMVRTRQPGGRVPAPQFLAYADLARRFGNGSLRITSRQGIQFHGVVKSGLAQTIRGINGALATTLAACGDVARNVMAPPVPAVTPLAQAVQADAERLSEALLPLGTSYHDIWVEGVKLKLDEPAAARPVDPLYGATYLPRKFKTAFAIPPVNDTDVLSNCLGFIAIADARGTLLGYNLAVGGGLGRTHGNAETFPRLADVIGFFPPSHLVEVGRAVLAIHRDWGDRTNRKHARLKYVLEDHGPEWFRAELERRLGVTLEAERPWEFESQGDPIGWQHALEGDHFLGLHVSAGRIRDAAPGRGLLTALSEIVARHQLEVRLTASQNLLLVGATVSDIATINSILAAHGVNAATSSGTSAVRRLSMACPALPTCGLALAESERWLPEALDIIESVLREHDLDEEEIVVRITGCPNGCARPYLAEIGLVGKAPGRYQLWLGANFGGTRLNRVWRESVRVADLADELRPIVGRYAAERGVGERFGDFCSRALWVEAGAELPVAV